jgi:hypothetical protein
MYAPPLSEKPAAERIYLTGRPVRYELAIELESQRPAREIWRSSTPWSSAALAPAPLMAWVFLTEEMPAGQKVL